MMFFKFLLISFQMKNNDDMASTQTRLAKVSNFAEEKTNLCPSVRTCMAITYGSKLVHFIRMRVPIYMIFNTSD